MARDLAKAAPRDTGALSRSVSVSGQRSTASSFRSTVSVPAGLQRRKAGWTEDGTRPHVIRPRQAKALRFRSGGRIRFAKVVHHPGNPARPWWMPTVRRWGDTVRRAYRSTR